MMIMERLLHWAAIIGLLLVPGLACARVEPTAINSAPPSVTAPLLTDTPEPTRFIPNVATASATLTSPTLTVTKVVAGPALTDVQFALEVDATGQLVFPATEFVSGVTRVYVRFSYVDLGQILKVESVWYVNDNRVSQSQMEWDGGEEGEYLIWVEDPSGLSRGQWRWQLMSLDTVLGGGSFVVGEAPRYVNDSWRIGFDPPGTWTQVSEAADYVSFSSPDQLHGVALRTASNVTDLTEFALANLELFRVDHPDAEILLTEDVTMNGKSALLHRVRYEDPERGEQDLIIVSSIHSNMGYGLWVLGPSNTDGELEALLADVLLSIQFLE